MKNLPKVKFILCPLNETINSVHALLTTSHSNSTKEMIYKEYPLLRKMLGNAKVKKETKGIISDFFKKLFEEKKELLKKKIPIFQNEWDKINDEIMQALSEIHELSWPKKYETITARVSLNYICLCRLKKGVFDVFYKQGIKEMKDTAVHEILHFIYYSKYKKVFPNAKEKEFEHPYMAWHLLEIVPQIILNDKKIQEIFRNNFESYEEFRRIKIANKPLLEHIQDFYSRRKTFEEFLKKAYAFVKTHEKQVMI